MAKRKPCCSKLENTRVLVYLAPERARSSTLLPPPDAFSFKQASRRRERKKKRGPF
jgi:hypothetical protein